ncbi:GNAT family N-acetyltransferase [Fulvivirga sp. 29W222]|uniref:GNAT family N-acetyltransferase n=1 Tax=Fulvivirga marina TaxID=2494733 RepID=A0A937KD84_9BACT|nr:GNAT family N-acetyltransferase [Fulvivirga marina]MBL6445775.1 GNAT family N-acetyltransferase [Fulvivirga marina]
MKFKTLVDVPFEIVAKCFFKSFENYYVQFTKNARLFEERWRVAKVRYDFSVGVFEGEELIAFMLLAIDERDGVLSAFNAATGVLPAYRGNSLVKKMFDFALPVLRSNRVKHCSLEVIQENENAVRAYEKCGFKVARNYHCFGGKFQCEGSIGQVEEASVVSIHKDELADQSIYSWENRIESIINGPFHFFTVMNNDKKESLFIINKSTGYLAQFDVLFDKPDVWGRLGAAIQSVSTQIKVNNVVGTLERKLEWLKASGLQNTINQYQMERLV